MEDEQEKRCPFDSLRWEFNWVRMGWLFGKMNKKWSVHLCLSWTNEHSRLRDYKVASNGYLPAQRDGNIIRSESSNGGNDNNATARRKRDGKGCH